MYGNLELERAEYERARDTVSDELAHVIVPEAADLTAAAEALQRMRALWDVADATERQALTAELFDAVYLDFDTQTLNEVRIKPAYTALFARDIVYVSGTDGIRTRDLDIDSVAC